MLCQGYAEHENVHAMRVGVVIDGHHLHPDFRDRTNPDEGIALVSLQTVRVAIAIRPLMMRADHRQRKGTKTSLLLQQFTTVNSMELHLFELFLAIHPLVIDQLRIQLALADVIAP